MIKNKEKLNKKVIELKNLVEKEITIGAMKLFTEDMLTGLKAKVQEDFTSSGIKYNSQTLYSAAKAIGIFQAMTNGDNIDSMGKTVLTSFFALLGYQLKKEKNDNTKNRK